MAGFEKDEAEKAVRQIIVQFTAGNINLTECAKLITSIFLKEIERLEDEVEEIEEINYFGMGGGVR